MKKSYIAPQIELIEIDNEIALALESNPPIGPDETMLSTQQNDTNPYKTNV